MPKFSKRIRPEIGMPAYLGVLFFLFLFFSCSRAISRDQYSSDSRDTVSAPLAEAPAVPDGQPPDLHPIPLSEAEKLVYDYIPAAILSRIESVVCLESVLADKRIQFSGFIVDQDGLILATAHDLEGHQQVIATLYDGRQAAGEVIKADPHWDLALIKVDLKSASHISLEKGRNLLGVGEKLYSVGCPNNLRGTVFPGVVNGPPRRVDDRVYWQVHMKIHPGSSGSPVFDAQGDFVAVVKGRFRGTDTIGFLIPFDTIVEFARDIRIKGAGEK